VRALEDRGRGGETGKSILFDSSFALRVLTLYRYTLSMYVLAKTGFCCYLLSQVEALRSERKVED
jgi:hypothetical protein